MKSSLSILLLHLLAATRSGLSLGEAQVGIGAPLPNEDLSSSPDDNRTTKATMAMIYSATTSAQYHKNNISAGPWWPSRSESEPVATLVKRDVIKVRESPLPSTAEQTVAVASSTTSTVTGTANGSICPASTTDTSCQDKPVTPTTTTTENVTVTTGYTAVVNLDDHNDALCDEDAEEYGGGTAGAADEQYYEHCFIDHNVTCVGDPQFCNLTYDEYRQLLMDYIYPSTAEWILIASHTVVFIMGLIMTHVTKA